MIIEIEGFLNSQILLTGKKCSKQQLKQMYFQAKKITFELKDFPNVFCRLYNFERLVYSDDIMVDYVLDTDTDRIYSPLY
ncbi:hypothetical protein [Clostridium sp.]|uniref:hypothetical protein n=1 Tax=Clostridium sp. TaxID=1506 RepID=UPI002FC723DA